MCVVIWAVSLGQNGAVDIFLAYFIDRLDHMDGVNIGGYTLGHVGSTHPTLQLTLLCTPKNTDILSGDLSQNRQN